MIEIPTIQGIEELEYRQAFFKEFASCFKRPFITVTYAQTIDGSIAAKDKSPLCISSAESMTMTHRLRTIYDAILVGIGTVKTDNPRLTTRLVSGKNPQPIVLDTHLRIPLQAKLLQRMDCESWLCCSGNNNKERVNQITQKGAKVLPCGLNQHGMVDLNILGKVLYQRGVSSLMVEGGARVITSFLAEQLVDLMIITIAPKLVGGLQVIESSQTNSPSCNLHLTDLYYEKLENDLIIWAKPQQNN